MRLGAVLCVVAVAATPRRQCVRDEIIFHAKRNQVISDLRNVIADKLQAEIEGIVSIAPSVVQSTVSVVERRRPDSSLNESIFPMNWDGTDSTIDGKKGRGMFMEFLWHRMRQNPALAWLYYGVESTGQFDGFRWAQQCEESKTCDYGEGATTPATASTVAITDASLVRVSTKLSNASILEAWPTVDATGGDPAGADPFYTEPYNVKIRPWYILGKKATETTWTAPYVFSGNVLGISVVQRVMWGSEVHGVLAADYDLEFLSTFINEVEVRGETTLFIMNPAMQLLATNKGINVTDGDGLIQYHKFWSSADPTESLIYNGAEAIFKTYPVLLNSSSRWEKPINFFSSSTVGSFSSGSRTYLYDIIGIPDPRWIVVMVTRAVDFLPEFPVTTLGNGRKCLTYYDCEAVLRAGQFDYNRQQLRHVHDGVKVFMDAPFAAISLVETVYNLGALNENLCATCPTLDWTNAVEMGKLKALLNLTMDVYAECAWLYIGFLPAADLGHKVIGYRRNANDDLDLDLWTTCDNKPAPCSQGTVFWNDYEETEQMGEPKAEEFWTRPWFNLPENLTIDEVAWSDPYKFIDRDIGLSLTKSLFEGNYESTTRIGTIASDITNKFMTDFVQTFDLRGGAVVYVMHTDGALIAASTGVDSGNSVLARLARAVDQSNFLVAASARTLLPRIGSIKSDTVFGLLIADAKKNRAQVEAMLMADPDPNTKRNYDWVVVLCVPEDAFVETGQSSFPPEYDGWPLITIVVVATLVPVYWVLHILWIMRKGWRPKKEVSNSADVPTGCAREFYCPKSPRANGLP